MHLRFRITSPTIRLFIAIIAFVGGIIGSISWISAHRRNQQQPALGRTTPEPTHDSGGSPLFYDRVGQPPPGFGQSDRSGKLSYTLEVDLADERQEAERLIDTLKERGIDAYYTPLSRAGRIVYRVRHGIYPSREEAHAAQVALKNERRLATRVVKLQ